MTSSKKTRPPGASAARPSQRVKPAATRTPVKTPASTADKKLDRELDRELDDTFPASDPLPWSHEVK
ncbi:MAG: hypothetical protein ACRESY_07535 [Steroidobacteraceae bacterium]